MNFSAIALDVGSSSIKVGIVGSKGDVLFHKRVFFSYPLTAQSLLSLFCKVLDEALQVARDECLNVLGIAISGNGPTWIAVDGKSRNEDVLFMWNEKVDLSSQNLDNSFKGSQSIFAPRLSLFKSLYASAFQKASLFLPLVEYLLFCLGSEPIAVLPEKRFLPFYWQDEDLRSVGIEKNRVPPFVDLGYKAVQYQGVPVFAGPPDYVAALIGTSCLFEGSACDVAGSSEGINITVATVEEKNIPCNVRVMPSPVPGLWTVATLFSDSGTKFSKAVSALASSYAFRTNNMEDNYIEVMERILPSYFEEITLPSCFKDVNSVVMQVLQSLKEGFELLERITHLQPEYALSGGHAKNDAYLKIKSHFTHRTFYRLNHADAELLGDAIIVFLKCGIYSSIQEGAKDLIKKKEIF